MAAPGTRTIAEHQAAALARVHTLPATTVRLDDPDVVGLVLTDDVAAVGSVPAFAHAAMDGYAVRLADLPADGSPVTLPVVADRRPGAPSDAVGAPPGQNPPFSTDSGPHESHPHGRGAVRIMTGAPLPAGFDAVVPVEQTSTGAFVAGGPTAETTVTFGRQHRDHVRRAGTDLRPGDPIARAGSRVTAGLVAAAAAAGLVDLPVRRRPRVAVLSTGSELAPLGTAAPGTIADSNSLMLAALVRSTGAEVVRVGAVPDDADALRAALDDVVGAHSVASDQDDHDISGQKVRPQRRGGRGVDLIVTSGGVSAGASDVVRELLTATLPGDPVTAVDVATVAMRPGKPQALATWQDVPWIAVPGNPVSAFVSAVLYGLPAVRRLAGHPDPAPATALAATSWASPPGKEQVVPVVTRDDGVHPAGVDAHHLSALTGADALVIVPAGVDQVTPGRPLALVPIPEAR